MYTDFYVYPNDCFGDADHLNEKGVSRFCEQMLEKYEKTLISESNEKRLADYRAM
jgi:hypothetical protein